MNNKYGSILIVRLKDTGFLSRNLISAIRNIYQIECNIIIGSSYYDIYVGKITKPLLEKIQEFTKGFLYQSGTFYTFDS